METANTLSLIIVSFNSAAVLEGCLRSIGEGYEVIVVDNASSDESAAIAQRLGARVIVNPRNLGYGAACNRGAAAASGTELIFLNPDVRLAPGCLDKLLEMAASFPQAAALGPRIINADGTRMFQAHSYIEMQSQRMCTEEALPGGDCSVGFLSGAILMVRRRAFEAVGGFDEAIFLYYEDDDLCHRLRQNGAALIYVHEALARHSKGTSSRQNLGGLYRRAFSMARSRIYISRKYRLPVNRPGHIRRSLLRAARAMIALNLHKAVRHAGILHAYAIDGR